MFFDAVPVFPAERVPVADEERRHVEPERRAVADLHVELADAELRQRRLGQAGLLGDRGTAVVAAHAGHLDLGVGEDPPAELGIHALAEVLLRHRQMQAELARLRQDLGDAGGDVILELVDEQVHRHPGRLGALRPFQDRTLHQRQQETAERLAGLGSQLALRQVEDQQLSAVQRVLDIQRAVADGQVKERPGIEQALDLGGDAGLRRVKRLGVEPVAEEQPLRRVVRTLAQPAPGRRCAGRS